MFVKLGPHLAIGYVNLDNIAHDVQFLVGEKRAWISNGIGPRALRWFGLELALSHLAAEGIHARLYAHSRLVIDGFAVRGRTTATAARARVSNAGMIKTTLMILPSPPVDPSTV